MNSKYRFNKTGLLVDIDLYLEKKVNFAELDLSKNIGDVLKSSAPDFGYDEVIDFEEEGKLKAIVYNKYNIGNKTNGWK